MRKIRIALALPAASGSSPIKPSGAAVGNVGGLARSQTPAGAGGAVVASVIGTSAIPPGGADIPGAKVAGTCLFKRREATPMAPDHVGCPVGLAPRPGAATVCSTSKGAVQGI